MIKRVLITVVGLFVLGSTGFAQQSGGLALAQSPDSFGGQNSLLRSFVAPSFLTPFSFARTAAWFDPVPGFAPSSGGTQQISVAAKTDRSLTNRIADLVPSFDYVTGEIGFLYGHSSGKFGGDYKQAYIIGEVGNDHLNISVGASYQDSNARVFRFGR